LLAEGEPCVIELWISNKLDHNPLICTSDMAFLYIPVTRSNNGLYLPHVFVSDSVKGRVEVNGNYTYWPSYHLSIRDDVSYRCHCFEYSVPWGATMFARMDYAWN